MFLVYHARTRLTYTLEVQQIARTITKTLGLNEELAELIALWYASLGYIGERMLDRIMSSRYKIKGFNE